MRKQRYQKADGSTDRLNPRLRHGFTLIEMMVSGVLLMTVFMIVVPSIYWVHREQRRTEQRQVAIIEVENLMERIVALPYRQVSQSEVEKYAISESVLRQLPQADLDIQIQETKDLPPMKKIQIQLAWQGQHGLKIRPVRLISWVSAKGQQ